MNLPPIQRNTDLVRMLEVWRKPLNSILRRKIRLAAPHNFSASAPTTTPNAILLSWQSDARADGYKIQRSETGDFNSGYVTILIDDGAQESYLDNLGATGLTRYYRILSTTGTVSEPHSVDGQESEVVRTTTNSGSTGSDTSDDVFRETCVAEGTEIEPLGSHQIYTDEEVETEWYFLDTHQHRHLTATSSHIIITERKGRTRMDELVVGDSLITQTGVDKVQNVGHFLSAKPFKKVVVQMREGHLYWANGILSHNIKKF